MIVKGFSLRHKPTSIKKMERGGKNMKEEAIKQMNKGLMM
jgi:hypothetical protein